MKKLFGVTAAMVTPMDKNGGILLQEVKKLTDHLIEKKVSCLYPNGTTGEMYLLSVDERKKIAEAVVEEANGRAPVFIHAGAMNLADTLSLAKHAHECGADGIGVVTPSFFKVREDEMENYYVEVANSLPEDFPVYLYNIPQCSTNDLTAGVCEKILKRTKNVVGIKYSFLDLNRIIDYCAVNNGHFRVMHGADKYMMQVMDLGCDGVISGVANIYPEPFVQAYKAYTCGDRNAALKHMKAAMEIANILKNGVDMSYYKAAVRYRTKINAGSVRKPLLDTGGAELEALLAKLAGFEQKYNY